MKALLEEMSLDSQITQSGKGINQVPRNFYKAKANDILFALMQESGVTAYRVESGTAIVVEHTRLGTITLHLEASVKNLDYDAVIEEQAWIQKQEDKRLKKEKDDARKAADYALHNEEREVKRKQRELLTPEVKAAKLEALRKKKEEVK